MTTAAIDIEATGWEFHGVRSALSNTIPAVVRRRSRRRIEAKVRALSDHQLRDIGIHRPDIGFITPRPARRL